MHEAHAAFAQLLLDAVGTEVPKGSRIGQRADYALGCCYHRRRAHRRSRPAVAWPPPTAPRHQLAGARVAALGPRSQGRPPSAGRVARGGAGSEPRNRHRRAEMRHAPPRRHRHARRLAHVGIGPPAAAGDRGAVHQPAAPRLDVLGPRSQGRRLPRRGRAAGRKRHRQQAAGGQERFGLAAGRARTPPPAEDDDVNLR